MKIKNKIIINKINGLKERYYIYGFTLIELVVVITILAILGTIAFISLQGYSKSARDSVRISDVSNMKKALGIYYVYNNKYPLADDFHNVEYNGDIVRKQGFFGTGVTKILGRNLSKVPKDPLTQREYIYSLINNQNEYQILSLMETLDFELNISTNAVNAAGNLRVYPKLDGDYNGVFVKTPNYIIATPSIINAEVNTGTLILDGFNIKSQIVNAGTNIPDYGNVFSNTGSLDIHLSVYTGSLNKNSSDFDKKNVMLKIQDAYTGTTISNDGKIRNIINTPEEKLADLATILILGEVVSSTSDNVLINSNNCNSGSITGTNATYSYLAFNNTTSTIGNGTKILTHGIQDFTANILCTDGTVSISSENAGSLSCIDGYSGLSCEIAPIIVDQNPNADVIFESHTSSILDGVTGYYTQNTTGIKWDANNGGYLKWANNVTYKEPTWNGTNYIRINNTVEDGGHVIGSIILGTDTDFPAFSYCVNKGPLWRLPTKRELLSIMTYVKRDTTRRYSNLPSINDYRYWSSSKAKSSSDFDAWYAVPDYGSVNYFSKTNTSRIICVHD